MHGISVIAGASWVIGCGNYDRDFLICTSCHENWLRFLYLVAFSRTACALVQVNSVALITLCRGSMQLQKCKGNEHRASGKDREFWRGFRLNRQCCSTSSSSTPSWVFLHTSSQLRERKVFSWVTPACVTSPVNDGSILMLPVEPEWRTSACFSFPGGSGTDLQELTRSLWRSMTVVCRGAAGDYRGVLVWGGIRLPFVPSSVSSSAAAGWAELCFVQPTAKIAFSLFLSLCQA